MRRPAALALAALIAILVTAPLGIDRPGLPMAPRGDEATYLAMAQSLVHDGDLELTLDDQRRLFEHFPFAAPTLVVRDDHGSLSYAAPRGYALIAAPFVALLGSVGPLVLNALLLAVMLILTCRYLRRFDDDASAVLGAAVYLLVGPLLVYAYWTHPIIAVCALVVLALFLVTPRETAVAPGWWRGAVAGAAIVAAAALGQPHVLWLALPIVVATLGPEGAPRTGIALRLGATLVALVGAALLVGLLDPATTSPTRDAVVDGSATAFRATIDNPLRLPTVPAPETVATDAVPLGAPTAIRYFLVGRHVGFLPYFPLGLIALVLALRDARDRFRWSLVLACAVAFLTAALAHDGSDAGSVAAIERLLHMPGNVSLAPLYVALFYLVTRWRPGGWLVGGAVATILSLGALLFTPFGAPVANATTQAHVRTPSLARLPLETAWLRHLPDYVPFDTVEGPLWRRIDEGDAHGDAVAVLGGIRSTLWLETTTPIDALSVLVRNLAPRNEVRLRLGDARAAISFVDTPPGGEGRRLRLTPSPPSPQGGLYRYPIVIDTERGARPRWRGQTLRSDYIGAELAILGRDHYLQQNVFGVAWEGCGAPATAPAGSEVRAMVRARNTSGIAWPALGPARVRFGYRWLTPDGEVAAEGSTRSDLEEAVLPDDSVVRWLDVETPKAPGTYLLEADLLFETVAWFSGRNQPTCRMPVQVVPGP